MTSIVHQFEGPHKNVAVVQTGKTFRVAIRKPKARGRHKFYVSHWGKKTYETKTFWNAYMTAYRISKEVNA